MIIPPQLYVTEYYKRIARRVRIVNITRRFPSQYNYKADGLRPSRYEHPR